MEGVVADKADNKGDSKADARSCTIKWRPRTGFASGLTSQKKGSKYSDFRPSSQIFNASSMQIFRDCVKALIRLNIHLQCKHLDWNTSSISSGYSLKLQQLLLGPLDSLKVLL